VDPIARFIQGVYGFEGRGLETPSLLSPKATYSTPADKRSQFIYIRAGNSCDELVYLLLMRDGAAMRYFPIGAKDDMHVSLAVVEDLAPESKIEIHIGAPIGKTGAVVLDCGLLELD
jgi:hypothetical protein